ncbi:ankyrin repeat domain-containing protein [Wolbachia endosymbiont of Pentalonia nigronervosa]|nr:ankyrin repeat domain-containing protein [Wolbachia endosymbiont of Pentalonia nigronervosa]
MTIEIDSKQINQITKESMTPTNQNVTGKENRKIKKKWKFPNILQGFTNGSKKTKKEPVNSVEMDKENHGTVQTNQVIEKPVEMGQDKDANKGGNTEYISNLRKKLKEINGQLKNGNYKIDKESKEKLKKEYNISFEDNTLLEVIHNNKEYNYNITPLLLAVQSNLTEVAKTILSLTDNNLHIQDKKGMNALHYAAKNHNTLKNDNTLIVKALLQHGIDINALDKKECTPLSYALIHKDQTLAHFMMQEKALPEITDKKDTNEETITDEYALSADNSLEGISTKEATTASEDKDPFDEQPTVNSNRHYDDSLPANENNESTSTEEKNPTIHDETKKPPSRKVIIIKFPLISHEDKGEAQTQPFHDETKKPPLIQLRKVTRTEFPLISHEVKEVQTQSTHNEAINTDQHPLRRVTKTEFPPKPNKEKGEAQIQPFHDKTKNTKRTYKTVILVASAAAIITTSMLTYFTTLPTLAIISIAFASALVFGSIATLNPMSKMYDTDCSKVCGSKNLFI